MEELKSTEALDREILEDARKKAERLLRNADQTAETSALAWAKKAEDDIAELERRHAERVADSRKETLARLPLDKRRERAQRAERLLSRAMSDYLASLPREKLLSLVEKELSARVGELAPAALVVTALGFAPGEAEKLLAGVLGGRSWSFCSAESTPLPVSSAFRLPSLVVEGGSVRVSVSVETAAEEQLRENRAELAVALLGEEASND